jgi:hypothetical protein
VRYKAEHLPAVIHTHTIHCKPLKFEGRREEEIGLEYAALLSFKAVE